MVQKLFTVCSDYQRI